MIKVSPNIHGNKPKVSESPNLEACTCSLILFLIFEKENISQQFTTLQGFEPSTITCNRNSLI